LATENFNIYRCIINKNTGAITQSFQLIDEDVELSDNAGVFDYIDDNVISNNLYGYLLFTTAEDIGVAIDPDIYIHYLVDFLVNTLGTDMDGLEMGEVRLHGEITEMTELPIVNFTEFDSDTDTAYASLVSISGLSTVDVYFEYRKSGETIWESTTPQALIAVGDFNSTIVVTSSGTYYIRAVVEYIVNTKTYNLYSNPVSAYISV